jgi:hypothetical protein
MNLRAVPQTVLSRAAAASQTGDADDLSGHGQGYKKSESRIPDAKEPEKPTDQQRPQQ